MLLITLLLAQAAASAPAPASQPAATAAPAPAATARPAPALGRAAEGARAKSLSEHAREMKAKGAAAKKVSFDDVRTADPAESDLAAAPPARASGPAKSGASRGNADEAANEEAKRAAAAQKRMDRAVERGLAVPERTSGSRRDNARREWDDAAEECRKTPGCIPKYRDGASFGGNKPLKTDQELIDDIRKRGFSEPHPLPK